MQIIAPEDGVYCVKPRSKQELKLGTIDISINKKSYKNQPIYYSPWPFISQGNETAALHAVFAHGNDNKDIDPMMFITSSVTGRIVGYNDDAPTIQREYSNISFSGWDSYLEQIYYLPTEGLHVSSAGSLDPEGMVTVFFDNNPTSMPTVTRSPRKSEEASIEPLNPSNESICVSPNPITIGQSFIVNTTKTVERIETYTIDGRKLGEAMVESFRPILTSDLGITTPGVIIITIYTSDNEVYSTKALVE